MYSAYNLPGGRMQKKAQYDLKAVTLAQTHTHAALAQSVRTPSRPVEPFPLCNELLHSRSFFKRNRIVIF